MTVAAVTQEQPNPGVILFVDDEQSILSSLRRLARRLGYKCHAAGSGSEGLRVMEDNAVDVVVSDMRMPEMTGAEFLEKVSASWPSTIRILLTGYSDIESAVAAINHGNIFRYLSKPWDDDDVACALSQAMEIRILTKEKERLERLTNDQNAELKDLNATLEKRVEERTAQVNQAAKLLAKANQDLKQTYINTVKVFASLIQSEAGRDPASMRVIGDRAKAIGATLGFSEEQQGHLYMAGLLCELGKLALPDQLVKKPFVTLNSDELSLFTNHPKISENVLLPLQPMEPVATILRNHCERLDGTGYPDGLTGDSIPIESRVLSMVKDYDALVRGLLLDEELTATEALQYLSDHAGTRYDQAVFDAFEKTLKYNSTDVDLGEGRTSTAGLRKGMRLTRDLVNDRGVLILPKGFVFDEPTIRKLAHIETQQSDELILHVDCG